MTLRRLTSPHQKNMKNFRKNSGASFLRLWTTQCSLHPLSPRLSYETSPVSSLSKLGTGDLNHQMFLTQFCSSRLLKVALETRADRASAFCVYSSHRQLSLSPSHRSHSTATLPGYPILDRPQVVGWIGFFFFDFPFCTDLHCFSAFVSVFFLVCRRCFWLYEYFPTRICPLPSTTIDCLIRFGAIAVCSHSVCIYSTHIRIHIFPPLPHFCPYVMPFLAFHSSIVSHSKILPIWTLLSHSPICSSPKRVEDRRDETPPCKQFDITITISFVFIAFSPYLYHHPSKFLFLIIIVSISPRPVVSTWIALHFCAIYLLDNFVPPLQYTFGIYC